MDSTRDYLDYSYHQYGSCFIPLLATWRGVFQGYQSMGPTAVSEVTEQLARIIFILIGSYLVLNVFHGTYLQANGVATFAAAVGAIAGLFTLWYYWKSVNLTFKNGRV